MNPHRTKLNLAVVVILAAGVSAITQERPQTARVMDDDPSGVVDNTYLITVTVNLGHQSGALRLTKDNFVLSDNRIRQDIPFFARIEPSNSGDNDIIYALGYKPPVWLFNGKRRKLSVVVYDASGKKLKAQFSPKDYPGTKEYLDGP